MNTRIQSILIVVTLLWSCLFPQAQAVSPAPGGCYPNFTTAEGCDALNFLTTGAGNTALGWRSLFLNTDGSFNTGVGGGALALNNADSNTAVGAAALLLNTTGTLNTAVGTDAMVYNDTGERNTAVGAFALFNNLNATDNTATGYQALFSNTGGVNAGNFNTATGSQALYTSTSARFNSAFGAQALFSNNTADGNSAFGYKALYNNQGFASGNNSAFGANALLNNLGGQQNSAFGSSALVNNVNGERNTAIGQSAGTNINGDGNVCIGAFVPGEAGATDTTWIRNVNTLAQPIVSGIDGVTVRLSDGRLGHGVSSRRYKQDIKPMGNASEALYALKPVSFHYNKEIDPTQTLDFGLIAEEVAEVNPELAVRDGEGKISNYRRDAINTMLLNEFLKEHRAFVEEQHKVEQQQKEIDLLKAELREQRALIQKVSDRIELKSSTSQVVDNNP